MSSLFYLRSHIFLSETIVQSSFNEIINDSYRGFIACEIPGLQQLVEVSTSGASTTLLTYLSMKPLH